MGPWFEPTKGSLAPKPPKPPKPPASERRWDLFGWLILGWLTYLLIAGLDKFLFHF